MNQSLDLNLPLKSEHSLVDKVNTEAEDLNESSVNYKGFSELIKKSLEPSTSASALSISKKNSINVENQEIFLQENHEELLSNEIYDLNEISSPSSKMGNNVDKNNEQNKRISTPKQSYAEPRILDKEENKMKYSTTKSLTNESVHKNFKDFVEELETEKSHSVISVSNKSSVANNQITASNATQFRTSLNKAVYNLKNLPGESFLSNFDNDKIILNFNANPLKSTDSFNNDNSLISESRLENDNSDETFSCEISISNKTEISELSNRSDPKSNLERNISEYFENHLQQHENKRSSQNFINNKETSFPKIISFNSKKNSKCLFKNNYETRQSNDCKPVLNETKHSRAYDTTSMMVASKQIQVDKSKNRLKNRTRNKISSNCSNFGKSLFGLSKASKKSRENNSRSTDDDENPDRSEFELEKSESYYFSNGSGKEKYNDEKPKNFEILNEVKNADRDKNLINYLLKFRIKNLLGT